MSRTAATDVLARRLAVAAWVLTVAVTVAALAIRIISGAPPLPNRFSLGDAATTAIGLLQVATPTVAGLILAPLAQVAGGRTLAVAGSTLAVAVLFTPIRVRVQRLVDRKFYRGRYDAERSVSGFAARLRDNVDLGRLSDEVTSVVNATVAPAAVGLWLRPREGRQ